MRTELRGSMPFSTFTFCTPGSGSTSILRQVSFRAVDGSPPIHFSTCGRIAAASKFPTIVKMNPDASA
jgi:hypothetical protein